MHTNIKMDQKEKQKLFTIMYIVMIIVVIATCIGLYIYLTGEGTACLKDPIQYYSNQTNQMCYCNDGIGWLKP